MKLFLLLATTLFCFQIFAGLDTGSNEELREFKNKVLKMWSDSKYKNGCAAVVSTSQERKLEGISVTSEISQFRSSPACQSIANSQGATSLNPECFRLIDPWATKSYSEVAKKNGCTLAPVTVATSATETESQATSGIYSPDNCIDLQHPMNHQSGLDTCTQRVKCPDKFKIGDESFDGGETYEFVCVIPASRVCPESFRHNACVIKAVRSFTFGFRTGEKEIHNGAR
jgi:hypothetical protein